MARSFMMRSFQATVTNVNGSRTQDNFYEFWPLWNSFLVSGHKDAQFIMHWFIRSLSLSEHTPTKTYNHNFNFI
jgi:hypothetical protein